MTRLRERIDQAERLWLLQAAATQEATRLGHAAVDTDHLLAALLVTGGPAAQRLRTAGLDLAGVRRASAELDRADLAAVGLADAVDPGATPPDGYARETGSLPLTPRAKAAAKALRPYDEPAFLRALAAGGGPAARILAEHALPDPVSTSEGGSMVAPVIGGVGGGVTGWATCVREVAVPPAQVWAVLDDPWTRPTWDNDVASIASVTDDGFVAVPGLVRDAPRLMRRAADLHTLYAIEERVEGSVLAWRMTCRTGFVEHVRVTVTDAGTGSLLTLSWSPELRLRHRPAARMLTRMARTQLQLMAQGLAQAAAS